MRIVMLLLLSAVLFAAPVGTDDALEAASPGAGPAGPGTEDAGEELEEFVPSEEISADHAISFPVDI